MKSQQEIKTIKKKQVKILDLKVYYQKKKITEWTQKQNGNYNGNNKERNDLKGLVYVHLKFQKKMKRKILE